MNPLCDYDKLPWGLTLKVIEMQTKILSIFELLRQKLKY